MKIFPEANYSERDPKSSISDAVKLVRDNLEDNRVTKPFSLVLNHRFPFSKDGLKEYGKLPIECDIVKIDGQVLMTTGSEYNVQPDFGDEVHEGTQKTANQMYSERFFSSKKEYSIHNHPTEEYIEPSLNDLRLSATRGGVNIIVGEKEICFVRVTSAELNEAMKESKMGSLKENSVKLRVDLDSPDLDFVIQYLNGTRSLNEIANKFDCKLF